MSSSESAARRACVSLLDGLDDDVLEYLIATLEGDEDEGDKAETVASFLVSCGRCEDDGAAAELAAAVMRAMGTNAKKEPVSSAPLKLLNAPTSFAAMDPKLMQSESAELGGRLIDLNEARGALLTPCSLSLSRARFGLALSCPLHSRSFT
eukprot:2736595-Pleurochrysis_carterae.AAC.1